MTITAATADQLEQLGLTIFNSHPELGSGDHATGLHADDPATDAQYYALIAPVMLAIDGRVMAPGFLYGLNITNALQGRPKHWFRNEAELATGFWPVICGLEYHPTPGVVAGGVNSFGYSIGLAACACICHAWAAIIRLWLAGNYPLAVNPPPAA